MGAMTDTAPARWIDYIPLDDIKFAARNPKGHDITGIGGSIDTHGMGELPLVDERTGQLVAGHGRIEALRARHKAGGAPPDGLTVRDDGMWLAPVVRGWSSKSDAAAESYLIGSNQWTVIGGWDDLDELGRMLSALADTDVALLAATGYTEDDIAKLLGNIDDGEKPVALTDQDDAPGLRTATIAQTGDLWHLGPHRLVVGDATKEANWELLLGGDHADMVWTDPPYGVSYVGKTKAAKTIDNDDLTSDGIDQLLGGVFGRAVEWTEAGAAWYVASPPGPLTLRFGAALDAVGVFRQTLVWIKDQFVLGHSDYHYQHEPIYYGWTPGGGHHFTDDRTQKSVFEIARPRRSEDHPTMKPVELITRHVENSTQPGQLVVDPFAGSGSTLIACHGTKRRAALIELDPKYADVILRRYQEHTGVTPTRDGVLHSFAVPTDDGAGDAE
jgi:DNA modification methylase